MFSRKTDIWSLGCIFYELLTSEKLFTSDWSVLRYAFSGQPPAVSLHGIYEHSIPKIIQVILSTINLDHFGRPSVENLIIQTAAVKETLEIESEREDPPDYQDVFPNPVMNQPITGIHGVNSDVASSHGSEISLVTQMGSGSFGHYSSWQSHW